MIAGLPEDALLSRPFGQVETWTQLHELMAIAAEVTSVGAANRRLKRPVEITRPSAPRTSRAPREQRASLEAAKGAVPLADAMVALRIAGRVRSVGPAPAGPGRS